ncbi:hypothetical protein DPM19_26005 [Actinomadura craniellae]|uniref:Uncharacterized protein n=1 Tax=Actinomadura craniellae TaxID=2231787 RepID=A0A365GZB8_9ACTN|nr:hypothetical protein [Actinomadura craniellae]RAY12179.1 hypothetical protein DPM19_26005 [Actinomadura craniellae]
MARRPTRLFLAAALIAGCAALPSSSARTVPEPVDESTREQLATAARTVLQKRNDALVHRVKSRSVPAEVAGVRLAPELVRRQRRAVRELETHNRAPVPGGPPYIAVRTRLGIDQVIRAGDRIVLDATEFTEARYESPGGRRAVTQRVRRRFEFRARGERLTLLREHLLDSGARPFNDPSR